MALTGMDTRSREERASTLFGAGVRHVHRIAAGLLLMPALAACAGAPALPESAPETEAASSDVSATAQEEAEESAGSRPDPEEAFLSWLAASREPDVEEACAAMTDELIDRMLAELAAEGFAGVDSCEAMTEMTAGLYRATGASADVTIDVQTATEDDAVLFVTYTETGDCGTVAMSWRTGRWVITEQSEECLSD